MKAGATKVIYVGGGKGGVGKSLVSIAIVDWLRNRKAPVVLVEGDQANPDAYKCYGDLITTVTCNFDDYDGWAELGHVIEQHPDHSIVVNSGARVIEGVRAHGYMLEGYAQEGAIDLDIVWPINRLRDSIIALKDFRTCIASGRVGVIRNLFFGPNHKFTRWQNSSYAADLVNSGAKVGDLTELPDRIIDQIYDERKPVEAIVATGGMVDRTTINHWRKNTHEMLDALL